MKEINFTENGGFPLEQETFAKMQTAYKDELYSMLKQHMNINDSENYIISEPTLTTKGWLVIEGKLVATPVGSTVTNFIKTTEIRTALRFGDGVYRQVYTDFTAEFVDAIPSDFIDLEGDGVLDPDTPEPNAKVFNYYELTDFKSIDFLPIDGSKPMEGNLDLGGNKLSNLDTLDTELATLRAKYFKLGYSAERGTPGRALVDEKKDDENSLHINYESDWENTIISGKIELPEFAEDSTSTLTSPLMVDVNGKVSKGSAYDSIPIGLIALWHNNTADSSKNGFPPAGWRYCNLENAGLVNGGTLEIPDLTSNTVGGSVNYIIYVGLDAPSIKINEGTFLEFELGDGETTYNTPISLTATLENLTLTGWSQPSGQTIPVIETPSDLTTNITGNLPEGTYTFKVTGETGTPAVQYHDSITIKIKNTNQAPVFNEIYDLSNNIDITDSDTINLTSNILQIDPILSGRYISSSLEELSIRVTWSDLDGNTFGAGAGLLGYIVHEDNTETFISTVTESLPGSNPELRVSNFTINNLLATDRIRFVATDDEGVETIKEYDINVIQEPSLLLRTSPDATVSGNIIRKIFNVQVQGVANGTVELKSEVLSDNNILGTVKVSNYDAANSELTIFSSNDVFTVELGTTGRRIFQVEHVMGIPNATSTNYNTTYKLSSKVSLVSNVNKNLTLNLTYKRSTGTTSGSTGGSGGGCFDINSYVSLASGGSKKLKNIQPGDKLVALDFPNRIDESTGDYFNWKGQLSQNTMSEVTVTGKRTFSAPSYYEIVLSDDKVIKVTEEHPLLVTTNRQEVSWLQTKHVTTAMCLVNRNGKAKDIKTVKMINEPLEVALLDVESIDNYVISGIVAHNRKVLNDDDFSIIDEDGLN